MSTGDHLIFLHSARNLVMGLAKHDIVALDLYLACDLGNSLTTCYLNIVRDLVNFCLGMGVSHIDTKEQYNEKSMFLQLL